MTSSPPPQYSFNNDYSDKISEFSIFLYCTTSVDIYAELLLNTEIWESDVSGESDVFDNRIGNRMSIIASAAVV